MNGYNKNKESSYPKYWDTDNSYGLVMSQKSPLDGFKWVEEIPQFNEDFIKNYNVERDIGYFLKVDVLYPEQLHELHNDLPFLQERMKIGKAEKLFSQLVWSRVFYQGFPKWWGGGGGVGGARLCSPILLIPLM